jgi:hypothetical protein
MLKQEEKTRTRGSAGESGSDPSGVAEPLCDGCRWKVYLEKPMPIHTSDKHRRTPVTWKSSWCECPDILPDKTMGSQKKPLKLAFRLCLNRRYEPRIGED